MENPMRLTIGRSQDNTLNAFYVAPPSIQATAKTANGFQSRVKAGATTAPPANLGSVAMTRDQDGTGVAFFIAQTQTGVPAVFTKRITDTFHTPLEQNLQTGAATTLRDRTSNELGAALNVIVQQGTQSTFLDLVTVKEGRYSAARVQTSGPGNQSIQEIDLGAPSGTGPSQDLIVRQNPGEGLLEAFVLATETSSGVRTVFHNKQTSPGTWTTAWNKFVDSNIVPGPIPKAMQVMSFAVGTGRDNRLDVFAVGRLAGGEIVVLHARPGDTVWTRVAAATVPASIKASATGGITVARILGGVTPVPGARLAVFVTTLETAGASSTVKVHTAIQSGPDSPDFDAWRTLTNTISCSPQDAISVAVDPSTTTFVDLLVGAGPNLFHSAQDTTGFSPWRSIPALAIATP
jgi:hypothetical protein